MIKLRLTLALCTAIVLAAALSACQSMALDRVRQMSAGDLANATGKAQSHQAVTIDLSDADPHGALCWAALAPIVNPSNGSVGVATAIEDARIATMAVSGPCSGILPAPGLMGLLGF